METIVLTPKQQKFCDEYLIDLNATKAALRAGYSSATALNGKLMTIPKIRYYLQQRTEAAVQKAQVNHEMILSELCKVAFGNMGNYFTPDGSMKPMQDLTGDEKAALWSVTVTEGNGATTSTTTRIKMNNKMAALDKIAKHLKFYEAEEKQPEVVYVYIDKDNADNHDKFDDAYFDDEDDDEDFWDDDDDAYIAYDTECRVAIAAAKEACKARRKKSCELPVTGCGLEEEGSELPVTGCELEEKEQKLEVKMSVQEMAKRIMDSQAAMGEDKDLAGVFKEEKESAVEPVVQVNRNRYPSRLSFGH